MGLVLAASAWLLRGFFSPWLRGWTAFGMAASIVAACAAAISLEGSSALGLLALWLPIIGEVGWAAGWRQHSTMPGNRESDVIALDSALSELAFADSAVTQQLVRLRGVDGSETISGCLRANFAAGERTTYLHVPFCPPLEGTPECAAETIDGAAARVKVSQVLRQGARLEVRLDKVAIEPQEVVIEFSTAK
jgi:hypothetical protein